MAFVRYREIDLIFNPVFRVYISGSSESGKTCFAENLLKRKLFNYSRVYYFHPDFYEDNPTKWDKSLDVPVIFSAEFPKTEDFLSMPENSCIVFDDLITQCVNSKSVDYLYRVLSGKRKLHVIMMTQRYFVHAQYAISIRNSSNYHVLMRNSDISNEMQIARSLGLKTEIITAKTINAEKEYPYVFIDRTNKARARQTEVFVEILSPILILLRGSMKYYLLTEIDFKRTFNIKDSEFAEYANPTRKLPAGDSSNDSKFNTNSSTVSSKRKKSAWAERKQLDNRIRRALHKYKVSS